jgi:hypothetical protein
VLTRAPPRARPPDQVPVALTRPTH